MISSNGQVLDFAPQALGETVPSLASGYFYSSQGLDLSGKFATYAKLYKSQPAIATVVDKIANSAARLSVKVWDVTSDAGRTEDTDSDLAKLMASPNNTMSPYAFWRWTFSTLDIYGEAFWLKQRDSFGTVINLAPMHPSRVAVKRTHEGKITYIFTLGVASAGILTVDDTEVVAFLRYNPETLMRGLSRLEPLRSTLLNEDASRRATESWWKRGARPSVILKHPGELSQAAQDRLKSSFDARHAGADLLGGTAVLEEGMEAQIVQLSAEEMQYVESRKLNLQEVCMVYDVPPPVIHILDHATYSNITEQMRSMYRDTMAPRLEEIESVIDNTLRAEFFGAGERMVKFALDEVLRGDFETRADAAVKLVTNGIMKPAEARPLFDLPVAGDEADALYANGGLMVLGSQPAPLSLPATPPQANTAPAEPAPEAGAAKSYTVRTIMGKLSRVKASNKDIKDKLVDEHAKALAGYFGEQRDAAKKQLGTKAASDINLDSDEWNTKLAGLIETFSHATAEAIGTNVATKLKGTFKSDDIQPWMKENAKKSAKNINKTTQASVKSALDAEDDDRDPDEILDGEFDGPIASRSGQISLTQVAVIAGLASLVAARLSDAKSKTWVVTSGNPRESHAAMDGETVKLGDAFSNGMNGPGDFVDGDAGEVAGCTCDLEFN